MNAEDLAWIILLLPLASAVIITLWTQRDSKFSGKLSIGAVILSFLFTVALFLALGENRIINAHPMEWLSVGDAEFSKKAAERLERLVDRTPILVMASHDPTMIGRMCNRVFRLEHGTMTEELQGIQVLKTVTS